MYFFLSLFDSELTKYKYDLMCAQQMKVDRELKAAIEKHGKVTLPSEYADDFDAEVVAAKQRVALRHA